MMVFDRLHTQYTSSYLSSLSNISNMLQYIKIMREILQFNKIYSRGLCMFIFAL